MLKINQVARLCGVASKTIRYYEEIGLLPAPARSPNGYRLYCDQDIENLVFIRRCRDLQIPIADIQKLLQVQLDGNASCTEVDDIIHIQLMRVNKTLSELSLLKQTLSELADCCTSSEVRHCEILRALSAEGGSAR